MLVVKIGGGEGLDVEAFLDDLARQPRRYVLVHGGAAELNALSERLGKPPTFVRSPSGHVSRYTDPETMDLFLMAYAGKLNKRFVEGLQRRGVNALGLTGLDGRLVEARRKRALKAVGEDGKIRVLRGDLSGTIERVNVELLDALLERGCVPVLTPPACGAEGEALNVDADRFAAQIAIALRAETLLLLSNVPGLLRDLDDESSLIERAAPGELDALIQDVAQGRMKKKLLAAREALEGGVTRVVLGDARGPEPVTRALAGRGTVIELPQLQSLPSQPSRP